MPAAAFLAHVDVACVAYDSDKSSLTTRLSPSAVGCVAADSLAGVKTQRWYWRRSEVSIMNPDEDTASTSLRAYYDLLREYRGFTIVWVGEVGPNLFRCFFRFIE